jgi:acetyltransferase-like isoleucine patch superfamily enzyme
MIVVMNKVPDGTSLDTLPVMISASSQQIWTRFWQTWQSAGMRGIASTTWTRFWMQFAGLSYFGRIATWLATWFTPPYKERTRLARYNSKGYIAPSATIHHPNLQLGAHVFIGDRVTIFQAKNGGPVELAERVRLHNDICIETGDGGSLKIGADTSIQPRCQFSAYKAPIQIGCNVQIAPSCAFYPYAHGIAPGELIMKQPLQTKGGIMIDDDAWLGFGAIVLDGVRIGKGAVVGAGAVVTHDVPDGAIVVGAPARVVNMRSNKAGGSEVDPVGAECIKPRN